MSEEILWSVDWEDIQAVVQAAAIGNHIDPEGLDKILKGETLKPSQAIELGPQQLNWFYDQAETTVIGSLTQKGHIPLCHRVYTHPFPEWVATTIDQANAWIDLAVHGKAQISLPVLSTNPNDPIWEQVVEEVSRKFGDPLLLDEIILIKAKDNGIFVYELWSKGQSRQIEFESGPDYVVGFHALPPNGVWVESLDNDQVGLTVETSIFEPLGLLYVSLPKEILLHEKCNSNLILQAWANTLAAAETRWPECESRFYFAQIKEWEATDEWLGNANPGWSHYPILTTDSRSKYCPMAVEPPTDEIELARTQLAF